LPMTVCRPVERLAAPDSLPGFIVDLEISHLVLEPEKEAEAQEDDGGDEDECGRPLDGHSLPKLSDPLLFVNLEPFLFIDRTQRSVYICLRTHN